MKLAYWIIVGLLFYIYVGYPLCIFILSKIFKNPIVKKDYFPYVTILLIVHNEEDTILRKIENIYSLDYPQNKLELVVVSDGSTDKTNTILKKITKENFKFIPHQERKGKAYRINTTIETCNNEILLFSDSRQIFSNNVLREIMNNFPDNKVGVVSGELIFRDTSSIIEHGIDTYWKYEKFIRKSESAFDSTVGATGAIYAIRKDLFENIPNNSLIEDVLIPLKIVTKGYRCVYESKAIAWDNPAKNPKAEERRKTRTIAGTFQLFIRHRFILNPLKNRVFFQTVSHKLLRLLSPLLLISLLIINFCISQHTLYDILLTLQIYFYIFAFVGFILQKFNVKIIFFSIPYTFILMNFFVIKGFMSFLFFDENKIWQVTSKTR